MAKLKRHAPTDEAEDVDKLVALTLAALVGEIFVVDVLFLKYRKQKRDGTHRITRLRRSSTAPCTFSETGRRVLVIKAFFWYLAFHMTWKFKWDPLVYITERWFNNNTRNNK